MKSVDVDWNAPPEWPFKPLSQLAVLLAVSSRKVPFFFFLSPSFAVRLRQFLSRNCVFLPVVGKSATVAPRNREREKRKRDRIRRPSTNNGRVLECVQLVAAFSHPGCPAVASRSKRHRRLPTTFKLERLERPATLIVRLEWCRRRLWKH